MSGHFRPYPNMKWSGMQWLGDVPEHWASVPPKRVLRSEASGPTIIKNTASSERKHGYVPAFSASGQDVWLPNASHHGDALVLSAVGAQCGKTFRASGDWGIVANTQVLRPAKTQSCDFWWYVTNIPDWWERAGAAQPFVSVRSTLNRVWAIPPLAEQRVIVSFLDHASRRIQRYIRAKQRLITLLEEQKQVIIHQAVTGQIDAQTGQPYPAYKPSGVEWMGQVPPHWKILPLKRAFVSMDYGISDTGTDHGRIAVLTMGHVQNGAVSVPKFGGVDSVNATLLMQENDLLFNRTNSADLVAKVGLFRAQKRPATFASYLVRMRSRPENIPEFMNLLLNDVAFLSYARREAIPSLHQSNLNPTRYGRLLVPLPATREQIAIAELATKTTSYISSAITKTSRLIGLVQEYQSRLVAGVITGKIDVTTEAARLHEAEELGTRDKLGDLTTLSGVSARSACTASNEGS